MCVLFISVHCLVATWHEKARVVTLFEPRALDLCLCEAKERVRVFRDLCFFRRFAECESRLESRGDWFFPFCEAEEESCLKGLIFFPQEAQVYTGGTVFSQSFLVLEPSVTCGNDSMQGDCFFFPQGARIYTGGTDFFRFFFQSCTCVDAVSLVEKAKYQGLWLFFPRGGDFI